MKFLKISLAVLVVFSTSFARAAEPENEIRFYSGIDIHYCTNGGGCFTSSFGYQWWTVKLSLIDSSYAYWTGKSEMRREYRGKTYLAKVFVEEWRDPFNRNRIDVEIGEEGKPETVSHLKFWAPDIHGFVHFDFEAMEGSTPEGTQRAILSFGPEYPDPPGHP